MELDVIIPVNKGLRPSVTEIRNSEYLTQSTGMFPYEGVLHSVEQFSQINTSALTGLVFPYPQFFVLTDVNIVCTPTAIYEYTGTLSLKISGLPVGVPWDFFDARTFIWLTNGQCSVVKDPYTGLYTQTTVLPSGALLPFGTALGNFNGQAFVGSANEQASGTI